MASNATVGILRVLLTADTAQFDSAMKRVSSAAGALSKDLGKMGQQATQLGVSLTKTLTLPLLAVGAGAIKSASDFETSFAGIRKTVGDATDAMGQLTPIGREIQQGMRDLAKQIPINVNELNRIGEAAGQLGIQSKNILGFTKVMADLGVTTNLSSDQAASSLARLANITQMPQDQFDRLGSTVVALGNDLATTESEIVDFGLRIAGAGHLAGLTEPQILAIGGAMSSVGVEAEAGGTAVQKVLLGITEAAATGNKNLAVFAQTAGMSAKEFAKAWQDDAAGAFTLFVEGLGKSGTDAFRILEQLGLEDQRLIRSFLSLANAGDLLRTSVDLGTRAWTENNALTKEATERYKTFDSQLAKFWAQVRDVGITLGTALIPVLQDLMTTLQPVIEGVAKAATWFGKLPEPIRLATVGIAALAASIGPALFVIGQLTTGLGLIVGAFGAKGLAIKTLTPLMTALGATTIPALVASLGGLVIAIASVSTAIYAGIQAWKLWGEQQERAKSAELDQTRRYAMMEKASQLAGRSILTYAEAVQIVGQEARRLADEQEKLTTVYDKAAGPPATLASVQRRLAPALGATTVAINAQAEALKQLRSVLSGADAFTEASRWMTVIGEIKDLTKLTTDEQQRALTVLQAALDKYNALKQTAPPALVATVIQLDAMNQRLRDATNFVELLGLQFDTTLDEAETKARAVAEAIRQLDLMGAREFEMDQTIFTPIIPGSVIDTSGVQTGGRFGKAMMGGLQDALAQMGPTILQALTGGGNILQSVGSLFGQSLGTSLVDAFGKNIIGALGKTLGGALNAMLPGLGALLGPLLGKIGGFFQGLFGVSKEVKQARTELDAFQKKLQETATAAQKNESGGRAWALTLIQVRDAFLKVGRSAEEAERLVAQLLNTDNPEAMRRAMEEINEVLEEQQRILEQNTQEANSLFDEIMQAGSEGIPAAFRPAIEQLISLGLLTDEQAERLRALGESGTVNVQKMEEAMGVLNGRIESLGAAFQQAKLDETSKKYVNAIDQLIKGGADVGGVLFDAREELSQLAQESLKTGRTLPANMKPWIEELHRAGLLVDENGERLEDLAGIQYGEEMKSEAQIAEEGWNRIIDRIEDLIELITGPLERSLDDVTRDRTIKIDVDAPEIPAWMQDPDLSHTQPVPLSSSAAFNPPDLSGLRASSVSGLASVSSFMPASAITNSTDRLVVMLPIQMQPGMDADDLASQTIHRLATSSLAVNEHQVRTAFKQVFADAL